MIFISAIISFTLNLTDIFARFFENVVNKIFGVIIGPDDFDFY